LDLLDLDRTVAENLAAFAPGMPEAQRMNLLARFLFRGPRILVVVSHDERFLAEIRVDRWPRLSGGRLQESGAPED
jgi:hypothetical protein